MLTSTMKTLFSLTMIVTVITEHVITKIVHEIYFEKPIFRIFHFRSFRTFKISEYTKFRTLIFLGHFFCPKFFALNVYALQLILLLSGDIEICLGPECERQLPETERLL